MPSSPQSRSSSPVHPDFILAICCLSLLLVGMDVTIVNVALPAIARDLHASITQLQWVIDAYTLVVASFLVLAGSMADRFGRRRVFQLGLGLFTAGSVLCSLAPSITGLVAFRVVQALGASMLNPVALSIIATTFQERKARARAVGIWGAVAGLALALGPLVGGALTQSVGWRSIFWINLPVGLLAILLAARFVPESKAPRPRAVDPMGQTLVLATLLCLTSAIIEGPHLGWKSPAIIGLFGIAAVSLMALINFERHLKEPLIDLRFFRSVPFSSATLIAFCAFATFAGFLFLNTLYLQQVRDLSAFHTGLYTLPLAAMTMLCAPFSGRLVGIYGTRPSLIAAGVALCGSTLMLTQLNPGTSLPFLLSAYLLFGIGFGLVNAPISTTAVSGMPQAQAGVAAAIASTSRQVGAALGVAVAGAVAGGGLSLNGSGLKPEQAVAFTRATHPVWFLMAAAGGLISLLGWASNTNWAKDSTQRVASLLQES